MICFRIWSLFARPCILGWAWRRVRRRSCPCRSRPRSAELFARRTWSAAWWWSWWRLMMTSIYRMDDVRMTITSQLVGQRWRFRFPSHKWRCLRQICKTFADRRSIFLWYWLQNSACALKFNDLWPRVSSCQSTGWCNPVLASKWCPGQDLWKEAWNSIEGRLIFSSAI